MRKPAKHCLTFGLKVALLALLAGCSAGNATLSGGATAAVIDLTSATSAYQSVYKKQGFIDTLAAVSHLRWTDMRQITRTAQLTADAVQIGATRLTDIRSTVSGGSDAFAYMDSQFATVGDYWRAVGFNPTDEISQNDVTDGLQITAASYTLVPVAGAAQKLANKFAATAASSNDISASLSSKIKAGDSVSNAKVYGKALAQILVYTMAATIDEVYLARGDSSATPSGSADYFCFTSACASERNDDVYDEDSVYNRWGRNATATPAAAASTSPAVASGTTAAAASVTPCHHCLWIGPAGSQTQLIVSLGGGGNAFATAAAYAQANNYWAVSYFAGGSNDKSSATPTDGAGSPNVAAKTTGAKTTAKTTEVVPTAVTGCRTQTCLVPTTSTAISTTAATVTPGD